MYSCTNHYIHIEHFIVIMLQFCSRCYAFQHRHPKLMIRGFDYAYRVRTWLPKVRDAVLQFWLLGIWALYKYTYTHIAWFLLSIWHISSFWRSFEVFFSAFYRTSRGLTALFRKTCTARPYSRRNSDRLLDFLLHRKER